MSEIITFQVGGCGINVGLSFWEQFYHNMQQNKPQDTDHGQYYERFVAEGSKAQKFPRTIFIDTDPNCQKIIYQNKLKINPQSIVLSNSSCKNIYAEGRYNQSKDFQFRYQESFRKQIQKCDLLSGFIFIHSAGGGCGSGLGQNVLDYVRSNYPSSMLEQFKILPGYNFKKTVTNMNHLEIYNTVLSNSCSVENTDLVYYMEDNAVENILANRPVKKTDYNVINNYYGLCLNEHIHAYISSGYLNTNQRKRATNLLPFPRVKFISPSLSRSFEKESIRSALDYENRLIQCPQKGDPRIVALNVNVRDNFIEQNQINKIIKTWLSHTKNNFLDWIPNKVHISIQKPDIKRRQSSWILFNAWQNIEWKRKIAELYTSQSGKKAYYHHYLKAGMDEMQFIQAESSLNDVLSEYIIYDNYYEPEQ